tara:strand:+ start:275 stop:1141 length:867 start_codon:yes stop_codon:yes gene_type:complete
MIIVVFLLMISVVALGLLLFWYSRQQSKPDTFIPTPKFPSIRDLHGECIDNPLSCEVDVVKTTIETEDGPHFEDEYGFKTTLHQNPEKKEEAAKISMEALTESMEHCKLRIPNDRLGRKKFDINGDVISREPIATHMHRNELINYAEASLDGFIKDLEEDASSREDVLKKYSQFLEMYGPDPTGGVNKGGGATKCDFYVEPCALGSDLCHPDAIKKYKKYKRPPIVEMSEEDYRKELFKAGLDMGEDGVVEVTIKNQKIVTGLSQAEKDEQVAAYDRAREAAASWASR